MVVKTAVEIEPFILVGGLDQVSSALTLKPGVARDALNFECGINGGYTRIAGYERFDGRPSPSAQGYWVLKPTITGTIVVGNTVTGATSAATGVVAAIDTVTVPGTAYLVITKLTGTFTAAGENIKVGAATVGHIPGAESRNGAPNAKQDVLYTTAAANIYRADILVVPGSGPILGVWMYNDITYAFRNNAGGTAAVMYKATGSGWTLVTTPALSPGGRYEFCNGNFGGTSALLKMFGCDGVNKGFSFDGTTFTQLTTGMALDKPNHVEFHKNYLFFAFDASLQHSSIGDPGTWSVVTGAAELALGETITNIKSYIGSNSYVGQSAANAMLIHTTGKTYILYGSSNTDFSLAKHSDTQGAAVGTAQIADQPYYLSDFGIVNLSTTQAYGNFEAETISELINPFLVQERTRATASCIVRAKSQYRVFFSDGYCIFVTFVNSKVVGLMCCNLGIPIRNVVSLKKSDNSEAIFCGSDSGYIYQMEKGPNFDGAAILAYCNLAFAAFKTPRLIKRFRKAIVEIKGNGYLEYSVSADLGWASTQISPSPAVGAMAALAATTWDVFNWDQFFWDGVSNAPNEIPLDGSAENIGLKFVSSSDSFQSFTISSVMLAFTPRRQLR